MKRNKSLNRKKAISLIVLVITIIIIVIIATTGVILVAKSGIFHSSTELTFKNDMSQYSDRIKNYFGSKVSDGNENIRISGENLVEYIPELKDSKYLDKLYVLDGELVIDGSKITEDEKNWAKEIGIHVSDSLEIIGLDVVTTENTIEIKSINTSGDLTKGVKYKFKLDDNEKESTTSSYTFGKLESGKYYLVNVSIVSSEGQELASYKKNIKTRINNDVVDIKLSTENWTKGPIKVTLEYENIPQAYKIQYKIGKEEFKDYTKEFEVTENNTFIYARLYNKDVGRDTSNNYVEIKNIDKEVPLKPTAISTTSGINSIKVRASGSQDSLSGILGYKYSLDGITYTSTIKAYDDYTFTNINADTIKTIYTKAVDNVGNESEVYSKDWSTWEASEKVKISIDPAEDLWTNKAVTVSLSHQSIPTNYIMQYRINNGSWTDGYTAKVTENRTKIEARLYNKNLNDEIGLNSLTIGNIDRIAPNVISAEFNPTKNTIEVSNIVAKDEGGSGIANYELSIKKHSDIYYTPYTSEQNKYTFEGLVKDTLYDIHIRVYDKAGNVSDYYSKSIPTVCTITLDSQGADSGKEGTKTIYEKYEKGFYDTEDCTNKITSISIPQKTGFVFDGYYTEKNGKGTKMIDGTGNITSNLKNSYYTSAGTLYANWVAKKITVIFMRNTTANDTTSDTQEFTYGVTGQSFSAKGWTKKGYTLLGWHEDKNSTAKRYNITSGVTNAWIESKYNASSNHTVTLYAIWQPNTYTVKYNGNGATGGTTANSSHTYDIDKKLTKNGYTRAYTVTYNHNYTGSTNTTKTATYSFVNWNTAANGTGTKYTDEATVKNLTAANNGVVNLYAIWKSSSITYVPTRTGYVFDGWFEDAECTKRTTNSNGVYTPTANKTLYAKWIEISYNISYNLQNGTAGTNKPATAKYDQVVTISNPTKTVTITGDANGTGATITGSPVSKPQTFAGWTYSGGNTATALYGTASNAVTTSWNNASTKVKAEYFKNLTATNNATVTMKANWTTAAITLPKATKTGYTVKWYKNTAGTGTAYGSGSSYSPAEGDPANITFYAKATANKYKVVYNNGDANSGTLPSNQDVYYDGNVTLGTNNMKKNNTSGYTVTYIQGPATGGTLPGVQNQVLAYTANGWATSQNGSRVYTNGQTISPYKINGNLNLYPSWTETRGTVTLATNNMKKSNKTMGKITFNYNGNGQAATTAYAYTQFTANGWLDGNTYHANGEKITPSSNLTLTPNFTSAAKSPTFPTPTREGYVFAGWYDGTGSNAKKYTSYNGKDDITLYAHWTEKYILITYYSNGATNVGSEETAGLSSDKTKSTITTTVRWTNRTGVNLWNCTSLFSRTGYAIPSDAQAWILGSATTGLYINQANQDFTSYFGSNVKTEISLYANWQEKELRVYFYPNGGTAKSGHELITTSGDAHVGASKTYNTVKYSNASNFDLYNCTTLFSRTGYTVPSDAQAWRKDSATSTTYISQAGANLTSYYGSGVVTSIKLYANWVLATYKITLDKNGGTGGASAVYEWYSKGIYKESSHTNKITVSSGNISIPTKSNHRFDGYYTAETGGTQLINGGGLINQAFTNKYFTSDSTLYARWVCTHDFGNYVTAGNENHRRTCKICGLTQTAAHQASNTKCNSTTLVIESLIETNTTRYIYEAKCSNYNNCKGRVNYYRKISDGKLTPGTIMNYSKYYDSNGNLVGVDKCPRVKCSVCGAWFAP